jgi:hypothetical protein
MLRFMTTELCAFHTSSTGIPAIGLDGSSCALGFTMSLAPITIATSVSGKSSLISSISRTMSYGHLRLGEQHVHVPRHASRDRVDAEAHGLAELAQAAW